MAKKPGVLIIVENLTVPLDRRVWQEATTLRDAGYTVSVICPGYITTPMTDVNDFPMPFKMSAERAANRIANGLSKGKPRIAFPLLMYIPLWLLSCLPVWMTDPLFAALPAKPQKNP